MRIHGADAAHNTIAEVHSQLYLQLLRMPISGLFEELEWSSGAASASASQLAEQLYQSRQELTPKDLRCGAPEHLRSVLLTADLLARHHEETKSREPLPGQV